MPLGRAGAGTREPDDDLAEEAAGIARKPEGADNRGLVLELDDLEADLGPGGRVDVEREAEIVTDVGGGVRQEEHIGAILTWPIAKESLPDTVDIGGPTVAGDDAVDARKLIGLDRHGATGGRREGGEDRDHEGEAMPTADAHFLDVFLFDERAALMRALARSR